MVKVPSQNNKKWASSKCLVRKGEKMCLSQNLGVWNSKNDTFGAVMYKIWQLLPVICKRKLKNWHKLIDLTSFTDVFLLFKSKNLFDLKSIGGNYCHKIDISFFLFMHWCYYFARFIQLFICINSHLSPWCL